MFICHTTSIYSPQHNRAVYSEECILMALVFPIILLCFVEISTLSSTPFCSILRSDSELGTSSNQFAVSEMFFSCKLQDTFHGVCSNNRLNLPICYVPLTIKRQHTGATSLSALCDTCSTKPTGAMHLIYCVC